LLLAFVKALHNRGSPWYLRGLIREPLRKIGVVLLHDIEHRLLGELAMVLGKQSVHVCELFVGHGVSGLRRNPGIYRNLLIQRQLAPPPIPVNCRRVAVAARSSGRFPRAR
jgi:hypothetical protein